MDRNAKRARARQRGEYPAEVKRWLAATFTGDHATTLFEVRTSWRGPVATVIAATPEHTTPGGKKFSQGLSSQRFTATGFATDLKRVTSKTWTPSDPRDYVPKRVIWDRDHARRTDRRSVAPLVTPPEPRPLRPRVTVVRRRPAIEVVAPAKQEVPV